MPNPKPGERTPGSGRARGTPNKVTRAVREVISSVFAELQGVDAKGRARYPTANMVAWAEREPGAFYSLASRLIPGEIRAEVTGASVTIQIVNFADLPDSDDIE